MTGWGGGGGGGWGSGKEGNDRRYSMQIRTFILRPETCTVNRLKPIMIYEQTSKTRMSLV